MKETMKSLSGIFLVTGTCIGGGMLALPIVTAQCGFLWSLVIFFACWLVMLSSSLMVLEVNSALPANTSFSSMAFKTLGRPGQIVMWVMFLLLLYALLAAYDTGGSSLLSAIFTQLHLSLSDAWSAALFTIVLGGCVLLGTRSTGRLNGVLLTLKLVLFLIAALAIVPNINMAHLQGQFANYRYLLMPIPVVFTAFGSHFIIPSIRNYIGPDPKRLRRIIFIGMLIPLIIYIIWQIVVFGVLPQTGGYSFAAIAHEHDSTGALVLNIVHYVHSGVLQTMINLFMDIAVTTSFLGIGLSLLDFFIDGLKLNHQRYSHRTFAAILTFVIPLVFAIYYPGGFIMALEYAGVFAAVLVLILPALMSLKVTSKGLQPFYRAGGGKPLRMLIFLAGIFIIILFIAIQFHMIPQ